ncbi:MAG: methionine--tRNA ligase subunit beta, partial [Lachnospiraceae bacterium]|nr:methionine--tRNA ligase subunit beta [Lachnospiraceae bacterium]
FGHPWLLQGGEKMSKSRGNVLYAEDLCDVYGVDAVRYYVLHEMPYDNDGTITWELMTERVNSDLANTLGNLVNRTISMTNKYFEGQVINSMVTEPVDEDLKKVALEASDKVFAKMDELRVADALTEIFNVYKRCNKYIDETTPWILAKDPEKQGRLQTVLYNLLESIAIATTLLKPFMPDTAKAIFEQLNVKERSFGSLKEFGLIPSGTVVTAEPKILFARLDVNEILVKAEEIRKKQAEEYAREHGTPAEGTTAGSDGAAAETADIVLEKKPEITYDDFAKMQFAVGEIIKCEEVPKSKKLLCSQVKIGNEVKQIVSGIKQHYKPEEMVGKKVMVLVNLKPATLAGVVSEGMLLCAEAPDGTLALVTPEKEMPAGAEIC